MKRIQQALSIAIKVIAFILPVAAYADPVMLNLAVGTLKLGTQNNEFLAGFGVTAAGLETPQIYFYSSSGIVPQPSSSTYTTSSNPTFTFDYTFSVPSAATLVQNATYPSFVGSETSSVSVFQGGNLVAAIVQGNRINNFLDAVTYPFPSLTLLPNTQYDLVITTLGLPSSYPYTGGSQGFAQIALDVTSTATPEPDSLILLTTGLFSIAVFAWKRRVLTP